MKSLLTILTSIFVAGCSVVGQSNVEEHTKILTDWIDANGYSALGEAVKAGYNGPLTLPMMRRNEVMINIQ